MMIVFAPLFNASRLVMDRLSLVERGDEIKIVLLE